MSTVNFSVPEDVKQAFNTTVEGQNKSAVITALMREAIERAHARQQHVSAIALATQLNHHLFDTLHPAPRTGPGNPQCRICHR